SRDRAGRAVLEVHGGKNGWVSPLLCPLLLCKLVLYLHSIPRRQVRDLGLTVIINNRKGPISRVLYKALLMVQEQVPCAIHGVFVLVEKDQSPRADRPPGLQMDFITSLKALHKIVDAQQLTSEFGGAFPYNHTDWLLFYEKLFLFEMDLQEAVLLLQSAIRKLNSNKKTDTAEDVRKHSQEHKSAMKRVLEDTHMVTLQRDGGAIIARMRKDECRFAHSEDYRASMDAVMCLYNQVEEGVHTLVMMSNQSLQHLDHVLLLRKTEEELNTSREWFEEEARRWQKDLNPAEETRETLEQKLADINAVLTQAQERREKTVSLTNDVERKIQGTCYPETNIFHLHMTKFKTNLAAFILQAEQRKSDLKAFIHLFYFCDQAFALTKECSYYLEHMDVGCYPESANTSKLKSFQERIKAFSPERFEEEKRNAVTETHHEVVRVWSEARSVCQDVKQRLEEKLLEFDRKQKLPRFPKKDEIMLADDKASFQTPSSCLNSCSQGNVNAQCQQSELHRHTQNQDSQARDKIVNNHKGAALGTNLTAQLLQVSREHRSEADLRNADIVGRGERNRALGRSYSEGSCIRRCNAMLTGPPLSMCQKTSLSQPCMILADRECAAFHQDSFCSDYSNTKLEGIQMDITDKPRDAMDDQDSQISRQESFCSGVSSPRQGWIKEEKSSRIYVDDKNSGYPSRDPVTPDRLKFNSDCNTALELENSSNLLKLQHIMEELLQTEREYVKALGYVMEHYLPELERQDVPQDLRGQRGSIFGNLEKLREFHHHHFLKELELCLRHPFRVGRCFLRHKESFGLYALYSKNKPRSDHLLINHGKDFFKQKQQLLGDKMDLSSYLLKPVQRISKYSLLLQDMLQECDTTSHKAPERAELQAALEVIQFQLRHGNNLLAMDDIQECDVNLKEQGQLIRQDEFLVSFRKKKCYRHIFLFQDLILFSKTKKTEVGNDIYIYKQSFKTSDIGMTHNSGDSGLCFEIWFRRRKSQDTYTLQARSYEVKKGWTKDLERILWDQAIHNREIRMQERVFMGIGCKPFMDIKPSEAAICDRAINCALTGRERGFLAQRPNSTGSASYVSSCSHSSSSSSSGRGSVSPVGYHIALCRRVVSASDPGGFSNPGDHDLDQENARQNQLALDIETWDLACEFNNTSHRTELNGTDRLIVRRGQPFTINLNLRSGSYEPGVHQLHITAETGPNPVEEHGTKAVFGLSDDTNDTQWSAAVTSPPGDIVTLSICSAPDAPIGRYKITLDSRIQFELILLFNPWCPRDVVYMNSEKDLEEYVLSQDGIIFRGEAKYPIPLAWYFGQFEEGILDVCLKILDKNPKCQKNPGKDSSGRRNPIYVSRVLSAMVNSNDRDNGVLEGCWKQTFDGGVSPMSWRGSVKILKTWDATSCLPVRYGQCWVFAAVACTVFRAVGIPCRVVTNYYSAHDTNSNLVIERYVDENGQLLNTNRDMIWNYHCWVESWMARPDLKAGFDGWQASDPTPQEKSEGVFCCGPVPVKAIKEGEITCKYDAPFVFSEVNADVETFLKYKDGSTKKVISTTTVGQKISTKSVGSDEREDITHLYKYPEGTAEEREAFKKANHQNKLLKQQENPGLHVTIKVATEMRKGCDFDVFALVTNQTSVVKKCRLVFASRAMSYDGVVGQECGFKDLLNVELQPGGERKVPLRLNYSKYCNAITPDNLIRLGALLIDYSTREGILAMRTIVLENPQIKIKILGEPKENRQLAAEITVQNPLPDTLEACCFSIEGANLTGGKTITE
ncbi:protein-glutamine gamma-glutamyltransferase 2-like, partial [Clarias magur]